MKFANTRFSIIAILTAGVLVFGAAFANAASFKFSLGNSGKTWQLANNNYLGSVGFTKLTASSTFTLADIITTIDQGTPVKFYAGPGLTSLAEFSELTPETVFDYTAITGQQNVQDAFYIEFEPSKVRFENFGFNGYKTLKGNGKLGLLSSVPAPVPLPGSLLLIGMGIPVLALIRNRKNQ